MRERRSARGRASCWGTGLSRALLLVAICVLLVSSGSAEALGPGAGIMARPAGASGELTGTVSITGAPEGFSGLVGVGACPAPVPKGEICSSPQYVLSSNGGTYTIVLSRGSWVAVGFYELAPFSGAFLGKSKTITIVGASTVHRNFTIPYSTPGTVKGTVSVNGVPPGVTVSSKSVLACPFYVPYKGGNHPSIACVQAETRMGGAYSIRTLPPGKWLLYAGYTTMYGSYIGRLGQKVRITAGGVAKVDLVVDYHIPNQGIMAGTVKVTGAPKGFFGFVGVGACPVSTPKGTICSSPEYALASAGTYSLFLKRGNWSAVGFYELAAFGGAFLGKSKMITIVGGTTIHRNFTIPYEPPGTVTGNVKVTKVPSGVSIQATIVLACPSADPYIGKTPSIVCVQASAPPESAYSISTLPPGQWLLYPGYAVSSGSYLSHYGVAVSVRSNQVTTQNLKVVYKSD